MCINFERAIVSICFGQIYADQLATLRSQSGEIPGTGAKFKYSRRTTNTRFSYHPRRDILIRRSNGVALVPYVDIITGSVLIVVENSAVSTLHTECLIELRYCPPA